MTIQKTKKKQKLEKNSFSSFIYSITLYINLTIKTEFMQTLPRVKLCAVSEVFVVMFVQSKPLYHTCTITIQSVTSPSGYLAIIYSSFLRVEHCQVLRELNCVARLYSSCTHMRKFVCRQWLCDDWEYCNNYNQCC